MKMDDHELIKELAMNFGHELCLGIRQGLYGCNAHDNASHISDGLFEIAEAINNLAEVLLNKK